MVKKLTITEGLDLAADTSITKADLVYWFTQALFGDVDRDHFASGTSPVVSSATAPTSPATGLGWHNSSTGLVSFWNGSEWLAAVTFAATAPSATGVLWYDTTLEMERRYQTKDGITGWHPTGQHKLVKYGGGTGISVGDVVYPTTAPGGVGNDFDVTSFSSVTGTLPMPVLAGVALEAATLSTDTLVICPPIAGMTCEVTVFTSPTVVAGDLLQSKFGTTVGVGGDPNYGAFTDAQSYHGQAHGYPAGVFAMATSTRDTTSGRCTATMLGGVGFGRYIPLDSPGTSIADETTVTFDDDPHDVDFSSSVTFQDADHVPWMVRLQVEYEVAASGADLTITFSRTSDANSTETADSQIICTTPSAAAGQMLHTVIIDVPTNAGSGDSAQSGPSGHGKFITYAGTNATASTAFNVLDFRVLGYWIALAYAFLTAGFMA